MRDRIFSSVDLPAPFLPMHADDVAGRGVEAHVAQRPDRLRLCAAQRLEGRPEDPRQRAANRVLHVAAGANPVPLAETLDSQNGLHHAARGQIVSANVRSRRRKEYAA